MHVHVYQMVALLRTKEEEEKAKVYYGRYLLLHHIYH